MDESTKTASKGGRGRPPTGNAKSATQRSQERDQALLKAGGKIISRLRLSPEAAAVLTRKAGQFDSERAVIEAALISFDK